MSNQKKPGPDPKRPAELLAWLHANSRRQVEVDSITELVERTGIPRRSLELAIRRLESEGQLVVWRDNPRTGPVCLEVLS
jgi:hypothetical protein